MTKVIKVEDGIYFDNGFSLCSYHESDCCESHWLDFDHVSLEDFKDLEFDLTKDDFFKRIDDYGIELVPIKGWSVKIPGYGSNNGYYSSQLDLILSNGNGVNRKYDISECQVIND